MSPKIIWLASYPKSGNTWVRFLIGNYFFNPKKKTRYDVIKNIYKFPMQNYLKLHANRSDLLQNPYNISKFWIKHQETLRAKNSKSSVVFLKTHNALVSINNKPFTNENHSCAAIYIVRDPRDVVISYSKYMSKTYNQIIDRLCSKKLICNIDDTKEVPDIEIIGSWKFNYISWVEGVPGIPRIIIRYEDLINDTQKEFYRLIQFLSKILNFKINEEQINFSVKNSTFENLANYEKRFGFIENEGKSLFFRIGTSNQWQKKLTLLQIKKIENEFSKEMKLLGYL